MIGGPMNGMHRFLSTMMLCCLSIGAAVAQEKVPAAILAETSVGMRVRIEEIPLAGSKLRARPVADAQKAEAILRILNVFPHGSAYRYNLEIMPLVPGRLDLRDYLIREDGSSVADLPELPVFVNSVLPFGQVEPNALELEKPERVGGYLVWLISMAALWILGLLAILLLRRKSKDLDQEALITGPLTLADRLRPLVERAQSGTLDDHGCAELERLILAYWRRERGLGEVDAGLAISSLRKDPEAGELLLQLEKWLHAPGRGEPVDLASLLEPYRNVSHLREEAAS
jgi:hypothetical protein